ncbi:MAG: type VI secretion system baseplate subunit TssK [Burkholderiaceae bacterium]|jgi:type VI secretion system protein ImpJ|nr:type VI secretion system baseplate subunit TssK [Burkholderiaceae bacterium]
MTTGPIFWHQGLYLQPQHFQYGDRRYESLLGDMADIMHPWCWGVRTALLDKGALAAGTLALSSFSGIFPAEGIHIRLPGNAICAGRTLATEGVVEGSKMQVYLGIARSFPDQPNVTTGVTPQSLAAAQTRYGLITGQPAMPDLYENAPSAHVRTLAHVLHLVLETEKESAGDMILIPIARIIRRQDSFVEDGAYVPPTLFLEDAPSLHALVREIRDRTVGKAGQLDFYKNLAQRSNMQGELAALFMMLRSLSRFATRLDMAAEKKHLPLWDAYALLREMLGEISVFSQEYTSLGYRYDEENGIGASAGSASADQRRGRKMAYVHEDPAPVFFLLHGIIVSILDGLSVGPRYMLKFTADPPYQRLELSPNVLDNLQGDNEYWLVLQSDTTDLEPQASAISKQLKMAASSSISAILTHALPGIPLIRESTPPLGVARKKGVAYLRIDKNSPLWADVPMQKKLSLSWHDAPSDLEVFLVVTGS